MSKIYEALLRAELDRLSVGLGDQLPDDIAGKTSATDIEIARPEEGDAVPAAHGLEGDLPHSSPRGAISRKDWNPDTSHLPVLDRRGTLVEQFRSLRSRLYELRSHQPLKSILISSAMPQEGKSFIAVNLAMCLAMHQNSKVLLIDGDMRRYTLHKIIGCSSQPGLASYLSGDAQMLDVMQQYAGTDDPNLRRLEALTFIGGGNASEKAGDLAANGNFSNLIQTLSSLFDWIVIDSSPVGLVSDAAALARSCDGVLLVAREGVTQVADAQRAVSEFRSANLLGFVLNGSRKAIKDDYYGYDSLYDNQE